MKTILALLILSVGATCFSGDTNETNLVNRIGMLPQSEGQQPAIVASDVGVPDGKQASLELIQNGKRTHQIIVIYPKNMAMPTKANKLIEVRGVPHKFETIKGNRPNNKFPYEVISVNSWKYIETEITQPKPEGDGKPAP